MCSFNSINTLNTIVFNKTEVPATKKMTTPVWCPICLTLSCYSYCANLCIKQF